MIDPSEITEKDIFNATSETTPPEKTPSAEVPATQAADTGSKPPDAGTPASTTEEQQPPQMVPASEMAAERKRRRQAERDRAEWETKFAAQEGRMQMLMQVAQQRQAPPTQEQTQPAPAPDIFTDTTGAVRHAARSLIDESVKPLTDAQTQFAAQMQYNNRLIAEQIFQKAAVDEAVTAFDAALNSRQLSQLDFQRVMHSPNPFAEGVRWFRERRAISTVGDDPQKWFEDQLEERLLNPEFQQAVVERLQARAETARATGSGQPVFNIPPSLNRAAGSVGNGATSPISEADIFGAAPSKMGLRG